MPRPRGSGNRSMKLKYHASRWAHYKVTLPLASRFAPLNYVRGRPTTNEGHWLWRVNRWVADSWINDWINSRLDKERDEGD